MSERWDGTHKGFPKHLDTILNWTGTVDNIDHSISLAKQVKIMRDWVECIWAFLPESLDSFLNRTELFSSLNLNHLYMS